MNQEKKLLALIDTLTKVEKSYFKKHSKVHGRTNNHYITVFEEFLHTSESNTSLTKRLEKYPFYTHISRLNNYLYDQILRSLRMYHAGSSIADKVSINIENARILFDKGLYKQCQLKLDKTKKMAYQYELWSPVLEVLKIERKLVSKQMNKEDYEPYLHHLFEERNVILQKQQNLFEYEFYYDQAILLIKQKQKATSSAWREKYERILDQPIFKDPALARSHQALILFYFVTSGYYFFTNQLEQTYDLVMKRKQVIESRPDFIKEDPNTYIKVLSNLLTLHNVTICRGLNLMSAEEFEWHIEKLKGLKTSSIELNAKMTIVVIIHQMGYYINNGLFEQAFEYMTKIQPTLERHKPNISVLNYSVYHFLSSYVYLGLGKHPEALANINELLNTNIKLREDMVSFARIIYIMIHYELGNNLHLNYAIKSTQQYLTRKERLFDFEKLILKYMKKITQDDNANKKQINQNLNDLKDALLQLNPEVKYTAYDELLHFISWLDHKTKNVSLEEAVQYNLTNKTILQETNA